MTTLEILQKIRDIQNSSDPRYFNHGIIPSYRSNPILRNKIPDDNIFCSASLLYILNTLEPYFSKDELLLKSEIGRDIISNFKFYTNKPERNSYNFWRKEPHKHFPNGSIFSKLNKFVLPDDIDTTSIIQLCNGINYNEAIKTKKSICLHANLNKKQIKNGHKNLRHFKAYSTWFGEYMPIEFDLCVLSNLFLWIHKYDYKLNNYDTESLNLIEKSISESLYIKSAYLSSPEYPNVSIILYHLARLISSTNYLDHCKNKLINDIHKVYSKTSNQFELILLSSSLIKLGSLPDSIKTKKDSLSPEILTHWWFTAGFLSTSCNPIIKKIAPMPLFHYRFYCPAFALALLIENITLKKFL